MRLLGWFPWKYIIRTLARAKGIIDPIALMEQLERFAHRSEVSVPAELLRAGIAFHARGLLNTKAIQTNRDWVWPYWVRQQFDPQSRSFLPRAFSITHVNLTHRNWTAVGIPGLALYPIVDPRGLLTPQYDGWSLDVWLQDRSGRIQYPTQMTLVDQTQSIEDGHLLVETKLADDELDLSLRVWMDMEGTTPTCHLKAASSSGEVDSLILVLRPCNPEGISLIQSVELGPERRQWRINSSDSVQFSRAPDQHFTSTYRDGDVFFALRKPVSEESESVRCDAGLASAAARFSATQDGLTITASIPLVEEKKSEPIASSSSRQTWRWALSESARLKIPDPAIQSTYERAIETLILFSPGDVIPGPYTYRRFWFRDAVMMLNAMLMAGLTTRVERALQEFPSRQKQDGYFCSQAGEWDSNGQVLWFLNRYAECRDDPLAVSWLPVVTAGARWIESKRCVASSEELHAGLLPAGFSAEHLGNNDYYYWDDFWAVGGLTAAVKLLTMWGAEKDRVRYARVAEEMGQSIRDSRLASRSIRGQIGIPASPYRRMDAGAIGSVICSYPLQLCDPDDPELLATLEFLRDECFVQGAFFQDMIHAGVNVYLTLHIAQCLLRAGNLDGPRLLPRVAALASSTGHWPEAIHPHTGGGCMGDGQHGWAAAEFVAMIRNCFVREEKDELILGSGILPEWMHAAEGSLSFGPTPTRWGSVSVRLQRDTPSPDWTCTWSISGTKPRPPVRIAVPGFEVIALPESKDVGTMVLQPAPKSQAFSEGNL